MHKVSKILTHEKSCFCHVFVNRETYLITLRCYHAVGLGIRDTVKIKVAKKNKTKQEQNGDREQASMYQSEAKI